MTNQPPSQLIVDSAVVMDSTNESVSSHICICVSAITYTISMQDQGQILPKE